MLEQAIVLSLLIVVSGFTIYTFLKLFYLERLNKIEKGLEIESSGSKFLGLKIGMLLVGIASGLLLGYLVCNNLNVDEDIIYPSFMLLFGGLSMIISHFWVLHLQKR
ncbi:hypothetical protein [Winogradskyella flava]|uniref:hypothetical protein n=1 Tax=Winogradskyella flava TaxID=1884876 RepID=UPI00249369DA|nr:hypothetical protein [Winogradskyella flava]